MTTGDVTADGRARVLADGNHMPILGLGVLRVPDGPVCVNTVRQALDLGYRHIDTAQAYGNEEGVGRALRESGLPRDEVFITTKFFPDRTDPEAEAEQSLRRLGVDQVDLYLVHWPAGDPLRAWPAMERCHERGLARSVGVSNFSAADLAAVMAAATVPPVVNQVQFSPLHYRRALLDACRQRGVVVEGYSIARHRPAPQPSDGADGRAAGGPDARAGAAALVPPARMSWSSRSLRPERIGENAQIFDFTLSERDMAELDALDRTRGTDRAYERNVWRGALRRIRAIMPTRRTS